MHQLPPSSQPIANLITALKQGMKLDLSAEEIADILWLTLEINKCSPKKDLENQSVAEIAETVAVVDVSSDKSPQTQPQTSSPQAPLVTELPKAQAEGKPSTALPIAVPAASALPQSLKLARSLRPLMRKEKSRYRQMLDEEATIVQIVDEQIWSPVMQPAPGRWLELAIVVEETNLLDVWQDTISELQHLMERHGAFRDVRAWQLTSTSEGTMQMFRRKATVVERSQPRNPRELFDPTGRRLILFVSDCTSVGWKSGKIPTLLAEWMSKNPVTVLQLLPERFWDRSALGLGESVWLSATLPGLLNDRLTVEGLPKLRRVKSSATNQKPQMTLPIVTLEPTALLNWAKVIAGSGEQVTAGVVLDLNGWTDDRQDEDQTTDLLMPEQLVQRFRSTASPTARRLAEMMATVPVSWSVIRLIQKNLLPKAETVHIAEVFLSGLLHQVSPMHQSAPSREFQRQYDFVSHVRNRLISGVFVSETERVMENVADDLLSRLPYEVRQRLSEDIERRLGRSMRSFEAFLLPEALNELPLDETTKAEILPFASVTSEVLQGLGGEYATLADRLQRTPTEPTIASVEFPALQEFEFETGILEDTQPLQPFEFTVATVEIQRRGIRRQPSVVIRREQRQAWGYLEELGELMLNLEMVAIPEGTFMMGSPEDEPERLERESPQHEVTVPPFFMGKYPVTQAQWRVIANLEQVHRSLDPNPSYFKGDNRPVEKVSWLDAVEFCDRLSQFTGKAYRLPSEAEWESACRALPISTAGTLKAGAVLNDGSISTPFHFGDTITPELANYDWDSTYNKIKVTKKKGFEGTSPVGQFKVANNFGLYDMHGNVWEWCLDDWHSNYQGAPIDSSAWLDGNEMIDASSTHNETIDGELGNDEMINDSTSESSVKLLRGGSWFNNPWVCRSASRFSVEAGGRNYVIGFRVVCSAPSTLL